MRTSARARDHVRPILEDLARRYLPSGDLHEGETALAKITAEREDPFLVLISTILSQRTRDEMTEKASAQLFAKYATPTAIAAASPDDLERLIRPVGFYRQKAVMIRRVSQAVLDRHGGRVPRTYEELIELPQVGPKTANCVLVYGYGEPRIPTDTHVHRVSNRLGLVRTKAPEATEQALMRIVPRESWLHVNELFIRFGKDICRPIGPRCDACSFTSFCRYYRTVVVKKVPRVRPRSERRSASGRAPRRARRGPSRR